MEWPRKCWDSVQQCFLKLGHTDDNLFLHNNLQRISPILRCAASPGHWGEPASNALFGPGFTETHFSWHDSEPQDTPADEYTGRWFSDGLKPALPPDPNVHRSCECRKLLFYIHLRAHHKVNFSLFQSFIPLSKWPAHGTKPGRRKDPHWKRRHIFFQHTDLFSQSKPVLHGKQDISENIS